MIRCVGVLLAALAGPALGQVVSTAPDTAAVTIYRVGETFDPEEDIRLDEMEPGDGLAMIRETRTVDLPAGRSRIAFRGVADTMIPQTAAVEGLPGAIIERNQDYNLLTPGALIEASVGRSVRLVRTDAATGEVVARPALLVAGAHGPVLQVEGRIEGLGCSSSPERLVFDEIPPSLADKPTFSVLADVPRPGRYRVRLSYLATGLSWSAYYVAKIATDGRTLDLIGWITLANQTSASFVDAPTEVVAGELEHDEETAPPETDATELNTSCWPPLRRRAPHDEAVVQRRYGRAPAAPYGVAALEEIVVTASRARQGDLGDYKLYSLPEPTTVASRQTKQVLFLEQKAVPLERIYSYRHDVWDLNEDEPPAPTVLLRLMNEKKAGLGEPLPTGTVAVMEAGPGGRPVLAGQQRVKDTPVGLPLEVELGRAMDVSLSVRLIEGKDKGDLQRGTIEAVIVNGKPAPIVFEYRQAKQGDGFKVSRASSRPGRKNGEPIWVFRLSPGQRVTLRYEIEYE